MAEFPSKICGACDDTKRYTRVADTHGDYLTTNTVPRPELIEKDASDVRDRQLTEMAIPASRQRPDLTVSPIKEPAVVKPPLGFEGLPEPQRKNTPCCCAQENDFLQRKQICTVDQTNNPYAKPTFGNPALEIHAPLAQNINSEDNQLYRQEIRPEIKRQMHEQALRAVRQGEGPIQTTRDGVPLKGILKTVKCPCAQGGYQSAQERPVMFPIADPNKSPEKEEKDSDSSRVCYLPKPEDSFPDNREDAPGGLGPWATGRVDWGPLAGITGVRPVVSKYSITRFSEGEWRARNKEVLDSIWDASHRANMLDFNSKTAIDSTCRNADDNQNASTKRLQQRESELHRYKCELERAISASDEEITNILEARRRLKQSMAVLQMPESITSESMDRRTGRLDPELVRDEVEEEIIRELALCSEIREQFTRAMADIEHQLLANKTAKSRLENDWSDKQETNEAEAINVALNNRSTVLLFKPGAVGFPDNQSSQEHWEKFTRETLEESEQTRQRSVTLRGALESISKDAANNLRAQADKVENALQSRINCMEEMRTRLENELHKNLKQIADIETTMVRLRDTIRRLDIPLKCAQTRLDNRRMHRPRVENCRDTGHYGLVEEVKAINDDVSALSSQLKQAEIIQADLMMTRGKLEREIFIKKKTLEVDRDRIMKIRSYYPSRQALQGY
ncbi:tektin-4-like [Atheta coriaria]|uniref:tektin-4-like n=1 Tax=Dalotia coriaria TaxID=877792 RepID=UPI0031F3CB0F